jgi:hypothetical protein
MKYFCRFCICLSLLTGRWLTPGAATAQLLSPAQARADLRFLHDKLRALHPGYGFYSPNAHLEQLHDSLQNALTNNIDYLAFYRHISPLITALHDGHTNLNHRRGYLDRNTRFLPFYIRAVGADYFISHNMSADSLLRRGTQLLTLNGQSLADLHRTLMNTDHTGSDGPNQTGRLQTSLVQFADYYAAWFGSAGSVQIQYRQPGDTLVRQTTLSCPTLSRFRAAYLRRYRAEIDRRENLSVRLIDTASRTAVLRVSSFSGPKTHDPFGAFNRRLKQAFRQIRADSVQNLIVDVQGNGGGMVVNSARLLQYWLPEPFAVMQGEEIRAAARHELVNRWNLPARLWFGLRYKPNGAGGYVSRFSHQRYRPRRQLAYRGPLYFLQNGASFSATTTMLAKTLDAGLGTFVGEATGSAFWGDFAGQFKHLTLPHSQMQVRVPLKKLVHAVRPDRANGFTVEPDYAVSRTYADLLANRDYMLAFTLDLIRQRITARPGVARPVATRPTVAGRGGL